MCYLFYAHSLAGWDPSIVSQNTFSVRVYCQEVTDLRGRVEGNSCPLLSLVLPYQPLQSLLVSILAPLLTVSRQKPKSFFSVVSHYYAVAVSLVSESGLLDKLTVTSASAFLEQRRGTDEKNQTQY